MITNHVPTKAEVNDITNAVLDGASAVMLSGETAAGDYPIETIEIMSAVLKAAETYLQSPRFIKNIIYSEASGIHSMIGNAVAAICHSTDITKIVCITRTGYALTQLSRHRLRQPILVVTENEASSRKLKLYWGVETFTFNLKFVPNNSDLVKDVLHQLYLKEKIDCNDVLVTTSVRYPNPDYQTKMNQIQDPGTSGY
jgi:pyruvate kinase